MYKIAPKPTPEQLAHVERLEAEARAALERAEASFQRCDTDGFLSQWANSMTAQRNRLQIQVLKNGGCARFPVLCDAEGNVIADREYRFDNGFGGLNRRWRLSPADEAKYGRRWVPVGHNSRVQKQLGLHEEDRWFPARAAILGGGTGLSGAASAYVGVERITQ